MLPKPHILALLLSTFLIPSAGIYRWAPSLSFWLSVSSLYQSEGALSQSNQYVVQKCRQSFAGSGLAGQCLCFLCVYSNSHDLGKKKQKVNLMWSSMSAQTSETNRQTSTIDPQIPPPCPQSSTSTPQKSVVSCWSPKLLLLSAWVVVLATLWLNVWTNVNEFVRIPRIFL